MLFQWGNLKGFLLKETAFRLKDEGMLITEILEKNAADYGKEIALIEREPAKNIRRQITWDEFNSQANASCLFWHTSFRRLGCSAEFQAVSR
jgi:hypothetical protein